MDKAISALTMSAEHTLSGLPKGRDFVGYELKLSSDHMLFCISSGRSALSISASSGK